MSGRPERPGRKGFARILGFALIPLVSALSPLIVIPALTGSYGATVWASVALAQSIGSAAGVVVELGWGLNGPQRIARAGAKSRAKTYALSVATKCMVAAPMTVPVILISLWLAPTEPVVAALVAVATSLSTLSPVWYFIGTGEPRKILLLDAIPRLASNVIAFIAISQFSAPLFVYPILLFVGTLTPPMAAWLSVGATRKTLHGFGLRRLTRSIAAQGVALQGRLASAAYIALPITIVAAAAPQALVLFSAAERLQRLALSLLSAFPNALQSWVGSPGAPHERHRRVNQAVLANSALGFVAGMVFAFGGGWASEIIFAGEINLPLQLTLLCGGVMAVTCVSRSTGGLGLVAHRKLPALRNSAVAGACIGLPLIYFLATQFGAAGALGGELITEIVVLAFQVFALYGIGRKRLRPE